MGNIFSKNNRVTIENHNTWVRNSQFFIILLIPCTYFNVTYVAISANTIFFCNLVASYEVLGNEKLCIKLIATVAMSSICG